MLNKVPTWVKSGYILGTLAAFRILLGVTKEYVGCQPEWMGMCGLGLMFLGSFPGLPLLTLKFLMPTLIDGPGGEGYVFVATWIVISFFIQFFTIGAILGWGLKKILSRMSKERAQKTRSVIWGAGWGALFGILIMKLSELMYWPMQNLEGILFGSPIPGGIVIYCNIFCDILGVSQALLSSKFTVVVFIISGAIFGFRRTKRSIA